MKLIACVTISLSLLGCGGGGSSSPTATAPVAVVTPAPTPTPVTSFPLLAGYKALLAAGYSANFTVAGSCSGTGSVSQSAAAASTFEGTAGYSATQTLTVSYTNCTPSSSAQSGLTYWDINYSPLGTSTPGVEYGVIASPATPIPTSVKVGDTAIIATFNIYPNSAKTIQSGQRVQSYLIEPDTSTTAIVNLITKSYNSVNQLLYTAQARYTIAADGALTIKSEDLQYSTTSTAHFILTRS